MLLKVKCEPLNKAKRLSQWAAINVNKRHLVGKAFLLDFRHCVRWRAYVPGRPPEEVVSTERVVCPEGRHEQEDAEAACAALDGEWLCDEPEDEPRPCWSGFEKR